MGKIFTDHILGENFYLEYVECFHKHKHIKKLANNWTTLITKAKWITNEHMKRWTILLENNELKHNEIPLHNYQYGLEFKDWLYQVLDLRTKTLTPCWWKWNGTFTLYDSLPVSLKGSIMIHIWSWSQFSACIFTQRNESVYWSDYTIMFIETNFFK